MDSTITSPADSAGVPIYTRKATGLVRQIGQTDQTVFSAASTSPLGLALVFGLFSLTLFPRSDPYVALLIALGLGVFVWVTFALLSAAIPRIGGDYTFNSRILAPWIGFAGNLAVFVSTIIASGLWGWWFAQQGLSPAFSVIGSVTGSTTFTNWGNDLAGGKHWLSFAFAVGALLLISLLAIRGTRLIVRLMTWMFLIACAGFVVSMLILLLKSHSSIVAAINHAGGAGSYTKTVAAAGKAGLAGPFSGTSTLGAIYSFIGVTMFVWWSTYMSAEFRGANQRRRQLTAMVGAGLGQGLLLFVGMAIFLAAVGRVFFAGALSGAFTAGPVGSAGYAYFAAIASGSNFVAVILAIVFIGWLLPGLYINLAMAQRALLVWSFDGLLSPRASKVNDRTHTPVIAITISLVLAIAAAAWVSFSPNFFRAFAIMQLYAYIPIVLVGIAAVLMPSRRPDLFKGSPADWRPGGIPVLQVCGGLSALVGVFAIYLVIRFHTNLSLTNDPGGFPYFTLTWLSPLIVMGIGGIWYYIARSVRRSQGVDLDLAYKQIPPD
jgi:basic amino acid/polyamine antiporter, APA family